MFQKIKKIGAILSVTGLIGLLLYGCDIQKATNALNKVNLVIGLQPITTTVSGVFTDAKTGDLIPNVTLSFIGNGANNVIDMFSDPITQQSFSGGFATFGISNNVTPTSVQPDSFTVVAQASGYETQYQKVILTDTTHFSFAMNLVNTNNPPTGTSSGSNTTATTTSSGAVAQSYSVQTQSNTGSGSAASLSVPDSTVFTDANGNKLTGTLTTHMTYYGDSTEALSQLPGGFSDGVVTAGFSKISITDANGHHVAKSSKPINVTFGLPSNGINPVTGTSYKNGDSLEVGHL